MNIIDLFEPKLPPINLYCLPPAAYFYRQRRVSRAAIRRSVASSTAIETGQPIAEIEKLLAARNGRFANIGLAK